MKHKKWDRRFSFIIKCHLEEPVVDSISSGVCTVVKGLREIHTTRSDEDDPRFDVEDFQSKVRMVLLPLLVSNFPFDEAIIVSQ